MCAGDREPKHGDGMRLVDVEIDRPYHGTLKNYCEDRILVPRFPNVSCDEFLSIPPGEWLRYMWQVAAKFRIVSVCKHIVDVTRAKLPEQQPVRSNLNEFVHALAS